MFRAYLGPSSGGKAVCIQQLVLIILSDCNPTRTTDSHLKRIISTSCCMRRLYLLMMDLDTLETCTGWFFFTGLY